LKDLRVVVKEIQGHCDIMREGDYFEVSGSRLSIPESPYFCYWAINSILPMVSAKQRELADDPGDWMRDTWEIECPDPKGRVILQVQLLGEE
jgi:anaerobic carbon-monoxide dehydrogenase iron sulfur subunit